MPERSLESSSLRRSSPALWATTSFLKWTSSRMNRAFKGPSQCLAKVLISSATLSISSSFYLYSRSPYPRLLHLNIYLFRKLLYLFRRPSFNMSAPSDSTTIWTPETITNIVYRVTMIVVSLAFIWMKYRRQPVRPLDGMIHSFPLNALFLTKFSRRAADRNRRPHPQNHERS